MSQELLRAKNLKKHFETGKGTVRAVDGVNFFCKEGETLGLVGESGSGKTTVANTIIGIYTPTDGELLYKGKHIESNFSKRPKFLKKDMRIVFQDPGTSLNPKRTIKQILEVPIKVHNISYNGSLEDQIADILETVNLPIDFMYKHPPSIGGGEKQMVAIARAIATDPSFVILDEPTSALDVSIQAKIIKLLKELQSELKLTYLFITHDLSLMRNMANRVAIMYLGKISEVAPTVDFFQQPYHPYTKMLLSSIPVVTEEEENLKPSEIISKGEIPSPVNIPSGCSFHLRCPEQEDGCSSHDPEMVKVSQNRYVRCNLFENNDS